MLYVGGPFVLKLPAFTDPQSGALAAPTFGTITIRRNGATDTAISATITTISTGAYEVTSGSAVPGGWSAGDLISAFVAYTYGGASGGMWTNQETVDVLVSSRHAAGAAVASVTGNVGGNLIGNVNGTVATVTSAIDALEAGLEQMTSDINSAVGSNVQGQLNTMFGVNGSQIDNIEDILEADRYIVKTTAPNPYKLRLIKAGTGTVDTGTVLLEQELRDVNGTAIRNMTTAFGQSKAP